MREGVLRLIIKLHNDARDYDWGSIDLLSDVLGFTPTGKPMAEVWFGTHAGSPAMVEATGQSLQDTIGHKLDYMLKFLAADFPLSIQVHPNELQAEAGFESEDASGIDLSHPQRNFKDRSAKREAIVAITEFNLLAGLRPLEEIRLVLLELAGLLSEQPASLLVHLASLSHSGGGHRAIVDEILSAENSSQQDLLKEISDVAEGRDDSTLIDFAMLRQMSRQFGIDRGLLLALIMKRFTISPGSAVFVECGVPHCYLSGLGVEILSSSDNVLRGGLTSKHVAGQEFLHLLDFEASLKTRSQAPAKIVNGLSRFDFGAAEFALHKVSVSGANLLIDFGLPGDSILVCTAGELAISNSLEERLVVRRGEAAYLSADAKFYSITGSGEGYLGSEVGANS
jgi:mannose-6-phosphate isomerase